MYKAVKFLGWGVSGVLFLVSLFLYGMIWSHNIDVNQTKVLALATVVAAIASVAALFLTLFVHWRTELKALSRSRADARLLLIEKTLETFDLLFTHCTSIFTTTSVSNSWEEFRTVTHQSQEYGKVKVSQISTNFILIRSVLTVHPTGGISPIVDALEEAFENFQSTVQDMVAKKIEWQESKISLAAQYMVIWESKDTVYKIVKQVKLQEL